MEKALRLCIYAWSGLLGVVAVGGNGREMCSIVSQGQTGQWSVGEGLQGLRDVTVGRCWKWLGGTDYGLCFCTAELCFLKGRCDW